MLSLLCLFIGFIMLVWGADHFVYGASCLAKKLRIPSLIIGLTIVAFGTSAPELAVSVSASLSHANEIALGNVLGSNIFNLLIVVGLSSLIAPLIVEKDLLYRDWIASIIATFLLLLLMMLRQDISRYDGIILLIGFSIIMFLQIRSAILNKTSIDNVEIVLDSKNIILFNILAGLSSIIIGGHLSVYGASELARNFGFSETVIGLTIVAIGTSLPELVTSLIATKRGETSIAIGNVIGSNLFNILFILGVTSIINPINVLITGYYDTIILLFISILMFFLAKYNKLYIFWGSILTLSYIIYTVWLFIR